MRVLFEELSAPKRAGGIDTACTELARQLPAFGISVGRSGAADELSGVDREPDCVHFQGIWSPLLAKRFWRWKMRGIPCIVSPHGMLSDWALEHKPWRKKLAWWLYQRRILNLAFAVHVTSDQEAIQISNLNVRTSVVTIPWGVKIPHFEARNTVSTPDGNRTAVFAGRLCPIKGLPMLFKAWQQVKPNGWKLRIIGPDEAGYRSQLEAIVRELGIEKTVHFEGALEMAKLQEAMADADLFILPSYSENFGMVVGEALALGLPVLTTTGTPWNSIDDFNCGWWVLPTADCLAAALREATSLPSANLKKMGADGREMVLRNCRWSTCVQSFADLYAKAARVSPRKILHDLS